MILTEIEKIELKHIIYTLVFEAGSVKDSVVIDSIDSSVPQDSRDLPNFGKNLYFVESSSNRDHDLFLEGLSQDIRDSMASDSYKISLEEAQNISKNVKMANKHDIIMSSKFDYKLRKEISFLELCQKLNQDRDFKNFRKVVKSNRIKSLPSIGTLDINLIIMNFILTIFID